MWFEGNLSILYDINNKSEGKISIPIIFCLEIPISILREPRILYDMFVWSKIDLCCAYCTFLEDSLLSADKIRTRICSFLSFFSFSMRK